MSNILIDKTSLPQKAGDKRHWGQLIGDSKLLYLSKLAEMADGPILIITPDQQTCTKLELLLPVISTKIAKPLTFPDWETLPYDQFSPHRDLISERLTTLYQLPNLKNGVILASITTLMHYLMPRKALESHTLIVNEGQAIKREEFCRQLESLGYRCVEKVMEHGEFARRGSLLDIYPMGHHTPFRIDLFDDEVDSIREFDPDTQRSTGKIENIKLLPAHECLTMEPYKSNFRQSWREEFAGNPKEHSIYQRISDGLSAAGIEYYLPLFYTQTETIFDYLPENTIVAHYGHLHNSAEKFWKEIKERHSQYGFDTKRPILNPLKIFLHTDVLFQSLNKYPQIVIQKGKVANKSGQVNLPTESLPKLATPSTLKKPLALFSEFIDSTTSKVLLCTETEGRQAVLVEQLLSLGYKPKQFDDLETFINNPSEIGVTILPIDKGFSLTEQNITLVAEPQLFEEYVRPSTKRRSKAINPENVVRSLSEIKINDPVVHIEHGIGRYLGLNVIEIAGIPAEYVTIEYAGSDRVYVPVADLHLISRYSGSDVESAPLHKIGSKQWEKAKKKAAQKVRDVAAELLEIYAKRKAKRGKQANPPDADYHAFSNAFPFAETPDQQKAINAVIQDMTKPRPMDRLICGDVGFGKTEVSMRAAFLAINSGMQVAMLVPTTLLAEQHYENYLDRFAPWPAKVDHLSRFRSAKDQANVLKNLEAGKVDIIVGTHKLLSKNIKFKNLGLLIVDEEHRFGVQQKEKIKSLRSEVDILTMTATPIPRTLNMAFSHIRELSIIATPPEKRLAVKTFVQEFNKQTIREAVLRELMRGGQAYFLHNEVSTIEKIADFLRELIPEARVGVAHGQMRERELEHIMSDFYHNRVNLLVCSTIVESGIDVPTANTIIINRADKLGLAQLHQLRGRVGRSHHQAYAYLLKPEHAKITPNAEKRLQAISELENLGAGFTLAIHDLEIRGAGEFLGEEQSGHMEAIGFELYQEMLEKAIKALKSGKEINVENPLEEDIIEVKLGLPALIPEDFIPDVSTRLILYKRISNAQAYKELDDLQVEMIDRFGLLPDQAKRLFTQAEIRIQAKEIGIKKIEANENSGYLEFMSETKISPQKIVALIQGQPKKFQLKGMTRLNFKIISKDPALEVSKLLGSLS